MSIINTIKNFIWSIADVDVIFDTDDGTYYDGDTETININLDELNQDYGFLRHLRVVHKCEFCNKYSPLLWAILHEVGHYYTLDDYDNEEEEDERIALSLLDDDVLHNPMVQDRYFNLPSEWGATEWAIHFVENNAELCKEFDHNAIIR